MKKFFILSLLFILFSNYHSLPFFKISNQKNNSTAKNTYIFGHKNPDCDTIFSAIGLSEYLNLSGYNSENIIPCRLGELNKESKYALETFQVEAPILVSNLTGDDIEVILVDHNTPSQSLDSAKNYIIGLIDHHAINGFETVSPIKIIEHPIGSTCSIIYQLFRENNIEISNKTAGLLISGIISDTILLKSSTTTEEDIEAFNYLTNLMGINSMMKKLIVIKL